MHIISESARITKATIEAAWKQRAKDHRRVVRDKECRGLSLIVTATSMAWLCSYRPRTRSANRALRRASGRPARFQRHTNHVLSKAIVTDAERGRSRIALEDLRGMRARVQVKGHQQARMAN